MSRLQTYSSSARNFSRRTLQSLGNELRQLRPWGTRAKLCAQTVGSVVLAVLLADLFHLQDRWWVAISAYTVVRGSLRVSWSRSLDRIAGTLLGALLAALASWALPPSRWLFALVLSLFAGFGLYRAIGSARSYAWILGTITALLVTSEAHTLHGLSVATLALRRSADVATGILSSLIVVALISAITLLWRRWRGIRIAAKTSSTSTAQTLDPNSPRFRRLRALQAAQGAITIGLLGLLAYDHQIPSFPEVLITVAVILLVPLPALLRQPGEEDVLAMRMANRVLGCLLAALIAVVLLPWIGNQPFWCLLTLAAGVWLSAHVQAGSAHTSYLGTQFGIGFIITFVQDHRWSTDADAPLWRLAGILIGLAALTMVILLTSRLRLLWLQRQTRG